MSFNELGLSAELLRAIEKSGYRHATPIQNEAIPKVLAGRDIMAGAQTGTGKTAAFTLPLLQNLGRKGESRRRIRALVLTPTRELAAQVEQSVRDYGCFLPFRSIAIFGGVSINTQIAKLRKGIDIVIATPGRLLDHLQQGTIELAGVETLVLDEADRMLDMGFIRDIRKIIRRLPADRQNLLFSATFPDEIRGLARDILRDPVEIQVATPNTTADRITQLVHPVDRDRKRALLSYRIGQENWSQVLVFTRTKRGADRLAKQLSDDGLHAAAIHGNKSQGARTRALADFKANRVRVLVATDIAARGLDIDRLPHVVNYELPNVPEDYVHRIGRTARAGHEGHAVSLVCPEEHGLLRDIEKLLKYGIEKKVVEGFSTGLRKSQGPGPASRHAPKSGVRKKPERTARSGGQQRHQRRGGQRKTG